MKTKLNVSNLFEELNKIDIDDPASMDLVMTFYEKLIERSEKYMLLINQCTCKCIPKFEDCFKMSKHRCERVVQSNGDYFEGCCSPDDKDQHQCGGINAHRILFGQTLLLTERVKHTCVTWEQPWYQKETQQLTRCFHGVVDDNAEQYCTGIITIDEREKIEKNWLMFVKEFDVPDKLKYLAIWKNKVSRRFTPQEHARMFIYAYLARGLQRTLNQVYRYVVAHYGGLNKGNLSKEEERVLEICFTYIPKKAVVCASTVLWRQSRIIYTRLYITNTGKPRNTRIKWTIPLASKFLKCLMKYSGETLDGLKNKKFCVDVWNKLAEEFNKPSQYLRHFWNAKLHNQLFIKCRVKRRRLKRVVFKILQTSPYKIWRDIRWLQVLSKFPDGFTHFILYQVAIEVAKQCPNFREIPLSKLVEHGLNATACKYNKKNKRLKTLTLNKDGILEEIRYSDKLKVKYFE